MKFIEVGARAAVNASSQWFSNAFAEPLCGAAGRLLRTPKVTGDVKGAFGDKGWCHLP